MDRVEREHIEYEITSTDGDPLAVFGDESAEVGAEPSPSQQTVAPESRSAPRPSPLPAHPVDRNASTALLRVNSADRSSIWTRWAAAGLISSGFAALAAGALF